MAHIGQILTPKPIESAEREIRSWLVKIGISGFALDIKHDAGMNISLVKFQYNGKSYEFRSSKQRNCRLNMHAIARVMEFKVRSHLMDIEPFDKSMQAYLLLEAPDGYNMQQPQYANEKHYKALNLDSTASNEEIKQAHKKLCKAFHPDMANSEEAKSEFSKKISEINEAWAEIKKERGL